MSTEPDNYDGNVFEASYERQARQGIQENTGTVDDEYSAGESSSGFVHPRNRSVDIEAELDGRSSHNVTERLGGNGQNPMYLDD